MPRLAIPVSAATSQSDTGRVCELPSCITPSALLTMEDVAIFYLLQLAVFSDLCTGLIYPPFSVTEHVMSPSHLVYKVELLPFFCPLIKFGAFSHLGQ